MSPVRRVNICLAVLAALVGAACGGDPPDKEMQQAQGAIDTARAAGADEYAREEFTAAQDSLKRSADAVAQRDYRLALNLAFDARERAQTAAKDTVDRKATARANAARALGSATAAVSSARARLKAAETAHAPARSLAGQRRMVNELDSAVQKARSAFERGEYPVVIAAADGVAQRMRSTASEIDSSAVPPARRRRH
jgi:Domain of unknown function (DUF4398)